MWHRHIFCKGRERVHKFLKESLKIQANEGKQRTWYVRGQAFCWIPRWWPLQLTSLCAASPIPGGQSLELEAWQSSPLTSVPVCGSSCWVWQESTPNFPLFSWRTKKQKRCCLCFFYFFFLPPWPLFLWIKAQKKSQILKPTSHTHTQSSHCYLHSSTPSPWALLLKRVFLPQPASRLSLEQLFLTSWIPAFLQTWGTSRALPCVLWGVPGLSSKCSFCRAGEKALVMIIFIFGYTNLTWAYTCLSKALGFNLWFSWAWCAA